MSEYSYDLGLLKKILSIPTAPYREHLIFQAVTEELRAASVPHFFDPIGNLILGVDSKRAYDKRLSSSKEPLRVFLAHTDHPGFHGVKWNARGKLAAKWFGGSPRKFLTGATVWLSDESGYCGEGKVIVAKLNRFKSAIESLTIQIPKELWNRDPKSFFGGFGFRAPVWQSGSTLYTKAADDLIGSVAILHLAKEMVKRARTAPSDSFLGILTRAEEVGFIGAIGHFQLGWLSRAKRPVICISLETSRTLSGALIGKGPVVRLGDRATTFDPGATQVLSRIAQTDLPGAFQRRIMDGGTCEATAATVFGFRSIGISIPLGNYHNQDFEGGPDARGSFGPAPEFVHLKDLDGMLKLCRALLKKGLAWQDPWALRRKEFQKSLAASKRLLAAQ